MTSTERSRACRARQKAARPQPEHNPVAPVAATDATVRTIVEEFTKLKSDLESKLAEVESTGQALALGQRVLSDPDLMYLVEKMWFKSETQRDRIRGQIQAYRRSLKSVA